MRVNLAAGKKYIANVVVAKKKRKLVNLTFQILRSAGSRPIEKRKLDLKKKEVGRKKKEVANVAFSNSGGRRPADAGFDKIRPGGWRQQPTTLPV